MAAVRQVITVPLAIISFVGIFYATGKLMQFLSTPRTIEIQYIWIVNLMDNWSRLETTLLPITVDAALIVVFILQHSLLRSHFVKSIWSKLGLATAERSLYNLATTGTILLLVNEWRRIPAFALWNVDVRSNNALYWLFIAVHAISWIVIYGGSFIMDFAELSGVKQVYYDVNNLQTPSIYKSRELNRLYEHIRHPSFVGFSVILWFTNLMSLDRLLLAFVLTIYMFIAWRTDKDDVAYQKRQLVRKKAELME